MAVHINIGARRVMTEKSTPASPGMVGMPRCGVRLGVLAVKIFALSARLSGERDGVRWSSMVRTRLAASDLSDGSTASAWWGRRAALSAPKAHNESRHVWSKRRLVGVLGIKMSPPNVPILIGIVIDHRTTGDRHDLSPDFPDSLHTPMLLAYNGTA
jgi:hypothetical protein